MSKWKCGICNSEFDNYQAQGFNGIIYCPLCYFKELYKREKQENKKLTNNWNELEEDLRKYDLEYLHETGEHQLAYVIESILDKMKEIKEENK